MVIYRPKEEQRYYYYGVDQTEVYWVHFTGNNVTNILRQHGISDDMHIIYTGTSLEYKQIFTSIINELRFCKSEYEELCVYYLMEIIYVFLTIFLYLLKCPQSLILSALRAFCFCGKPHISRSIFLYFHYQAWLKSW